MKVKGCKFIVGNVSVGARQKKTLGEHNENRVHVHSSLGMFYTLRDER